MLKQLARGALDNFPIQVLPEMLSYKASCMSKHFCIDFLPSLPAFSHPSHLVMIFFPFLPVYLDLIIALFPVNVSRT